MGMLQNAPWYMCCLCLCSMLMTLVQALRGAKAFHDSFVQLLAAYLGHISKSAAGSWTVLPPADVPQQQNSYDCGVFAIGFALVTLVGR